MAATSPFTYVDSSTSGKPPVVGQLDAAPLDLLVQPVQLFVVELELLNEGGEG